MSEELKPCPFCGGSKINITKGNVIICKTCGAGISGFDATMSMVKWNHRHEAKPLTVEQIGNIRREILKKADVCSPSELLYQQIDQAIHAAMPPNQSERIPGREEIRRVLYVAWKETEELGDFIERQTDAIMELLK